MGGTRGVWGPRYALIGAFEGRIRLRRQNLVALRTVQLAHDARFPPGVGWGRMTSLQRSAQFLFLLSMAACCALPPEASVEVALEDSLPGDPRWREDALFERVLVLGASASAGFGLNQDLGTVTAAAFGIESSGVLTIASSFFFMRPEKNGRAALEKAREFDPTLVIAIDFPFWFGYGRRQEAQRSGSMSLGLELLDSLDCPIIVGGVPDMTAAIGLMLTKEQVPSIESQEQLNRQVLDWSDERPRVAFYDLRGSQRKVEGGPRQLRGETWPPEGALILQPDRLHPTLVGLVGLVLEALEEVGLGQHIEGTPTEILEIARELRRNR